MCTVCNSLLWLQYDFLFKQKIYNILNIPMIHWLMRRTTCVVIRHGFGYIKYFASVITSIRNSDWLLYYSDRFRNFNNVSQLMHVIKYSYPYLLSMHANDDLIKQFNFPIYSSLSLIWQQIPQMRIPCSLLPKVSIAFPFHISSFAWLV